MRLGREAFIGWTGRHRDKYVWLYMYVPIKALHIPRMRYGIMILPCYPTLDLSGTWFR